MRTGGGPGGQSTSLPRPVSRSISTVIPAITPQGAGGKTDGEPEVEPEGAGAEVEDGVAEPEVHVFEAVHRARIRRIAVAVRDREDRLQAVGDAVLELRQDARASLVRKAEMACPERGLELVLVLGDDRLGDRELLGEGRTSPPRRAPLARGATRGQRRAPGSWPDIAPPPPFGSRRRPARPAIIMAPSLEAADRIREAITVPAQSRGGGQDFDGVLRVRSWHLCPEGARGEFGR